MSNTSDKLREFVFIQIRILTALGDIKGAVVEPEEELINNHIERLTALISEHYYTREFLLWFHDNVQIESREETFLVYNDIRFYTLNEVRDFWQRVQEKKEYVKRKKNEQ
jgi:hypothetical protein